MNEPDSCGIYSRPQQPVVDLESFNVGENVASVMSSSQIARMILRVFNLGTNKNVNKQDGKKDMAYVAIKELT